MQETLIRSLGQKDPLQKEIATHSSILTWEIPWTDEPSRLETIGLQRVRHNLVTEHACTQVEKGEQTRSFWGCGLENVAVRCHFQIYFKTIRRIQEGTMNRIKVFGSKCLHTEHNISFKQEPNLNLHNCYPKQTLCWQSPASCNEFTHIHSVSFSSIVTSQQRFSQFTFVL